MKQQPELLLKDIMSTDVFCVDDHCTIGEMVLRMKQGHCSGVVVIKDNKAAGILTERDLLRLLHRRVGKHHLVNEFMSSPVRLASETLGFRAAYVQLCLSRFRHLVVTNGNDEIVGIASENNFLGHMGAEIFHRTHSLRTIIDQAVPKFAPSTPVSDAIERMIQEKRGCVVVVENDKPLGIFTEYQAPTVLARHADGSSTLLEEVMRSGVQTVSLNTTPVEAVGHLVTAKLGYLVVTNDDGTLYGVIDQNKLLENVRANIQDELAARTVAEDKYQTVLDEQTAILNSGIVGIARTRDRKYIWLNSTYENILGYSREELVGQSTKVVFESESGFQYFGDQVNQALNKGQVYRGEHYFRTKSGELRYCLISGARLPSSENDFVWSLIDITERKKLEEKLADFTLDFEAFLDQTSDFIYFKDINSRFRFCSQTLAKITHHAHWRDMIGKHDFEVFPADTAKVYSEEEMPVFEQGKPLLNKVNPYYDEAGKTCYVMTNKWPLFDKAGKVVGIFGISRDITELKKAEELLSKAANYSRSLIEASLDPLVTISAEGKVTDVNEATELITGCTREELIGSDFSDYFTDPAQARAGYQEVFDKGEVQNYPLSIRNKSGPVIPVLYNASVYRDTSGKVLGVFAAARDITEQKTAERVLQESKDLAERLAQSKSQFLANMSHEIRTPMNGIIGLSQLALNQQTSPQVRDYLEKISSSSQSLLGILNDILDFSKLEAGRMSIENTQFDLDVVLNNLRNLFEERAEAKHLEFDIGVGAGTPRDLVGDAMRIQQILSNLLGNAIKFTAQGKVTLNVTTSQMEGSQAVLTFAVADSGIGMSRADMEKLFQPFSQADGSITRKFGGTGLGLVISENLLKLMGSEFRVVSQPGKGSIFCFDLLLGIASHGRVRDERHRDKHLAGHLEEKLQEKATSLNGAKILVAEDNTINQQVVREFLKLSGMEVTIANHGQETLDWLEQKDFDAILMDVHMPVMGGVEATQRIRQNPKYADLPIIALTAGVTEEERQSVIESGMNDFVAKPVNPEALIAALTRWISS